MFRVDRRQAANVCLTFARRELYAYKRGKLKILARERRRIDDDITVLYLILTVSAFQVEKKVEKREGMRLAISVEFEFSRTRSFSLELFIG